VLAFPPKHLDGLAIGPFFVPHPERKTADSANVARARQPQRAQR
jgi:hypothetical protein